MTQLPSLMRSPADDPLRCQRIFSLFVAGALIACGGAKYPLSVSLVGSGSGKVSSSRRGQIDCRPTCSASLGAGSSIVLTAASAAGSDFTGWSGACSGTETCTVVMDGAKAVSARFSLPRIVFSSSRKLDGTDAPNTFNIWRVNVDGTGVTPITGATAAGADSVAPQWSPDGTSVVFESWRNLDGTDSGSFFGTFNVWRVNVDGTGLAPLTRAAAGGADSYAPQWSPDGARVVFYSSRNLDGTDTPNPNFTRNIWRVNADGTGLTPITGATAAGADSVAPQWSPDGASIVFESWRKLMGQTRQTQMLTTSGE